MCGTWGEFVGNPSDLLLGPGYGVAHRAAFREVLPWGFEYGPDDLAAVGGG